MKKKSTVEIEVKIDGIYLIINNEVDADRITRKQVLDLVESYGIKDANFQVIQEIFQSSEMHIERKISENRTIVKRNEEIVVEISKDRMSASIRFSSPAGGGANATKDDIMDALAKGNVKFGIDEGKIEDVAERHIQGASYIIASGKPPVDGKDGYIDFNFNAEIKKDNKPKLLENGNVDFRNLELIEMVAKGQRLLTIVPPAEGEDGKDVIGNTIPYKRGKPSAAVIKGQGVTTNDDGTEMYAETNGQVLYANKKLSVSAILEIPTNVGPGTGNIEFNGSVVIRGNVTSGYSVRAEGNIDIHGTVEASKITAGYNIFMFSGVQGGEKAEIIAGGDINTKFAESCTLRAGRNIVANSIMHSDVYCDGTLELAGKNGNLVGGTINVGERIKAKTIGSSMATATEIVVGNAPEKLEDYKELSDEYERKLDEYNKMNNLLQKLIAEHNSGKSDDDKKNLLLKSLQLKTQLKDELTALEAKVSEMKEGLETQRGEIYAYGIIRSGVKVTIGNATMFVRDDIQNALLKNENARIVVRSAV